jgi:hypothetical protein
MTNWPAGMNEDLISFADQAKVKVICFPQLAKFFLVGLAAVLTAAIPAQSRKPEKSRATR